MKARESMRLACPSSYQTVDALDAVVSNAKFVLLPTHEVPSMGFPLALLHLADPIPYGRPCRLVQLPAHAASRPREISQAQNVALKRQGRAEREERWGGGHGPARTGHGRRANDG